MFSDIVGAVLKGKENLNWWHHNSYFDLPVIKLLQNNRGYSLYTVLPTFAVCCEKVTVWIPFGALLVVVNMTVWSKPFKVTAIWGLPSRVCTLHRSHSSSASDPLYLNVATKTYEGGRPSGKRFLKNRINRRWSACHTLSYIKMIKKREKHP